jgi:hypothetical protein
MSLEFLNQTPKNAFRKIERDLSTVNPSLDISSFKKMTPNQLDERIQKLENKEKRMIGESKYGSWLTNSEYVETKLLKEALEFLKEYKKEKEKQEILVPGFIYYRGVKQFGPNISGTRCFYMKESKNPIWVNFKMPIAIAKAFNVLRYGTEDDFKTIYVEKSDGRIDGIRNVCLEHITESTSEALKDIEDYCDKRWTGPWPWEVPAPYKLRSMIEDRKQMRKQSVNEMRNRFNHIINLLNEGEMDRYEVISAAEEITGKIQGMIEDLGKIAGEGILTLKDNARTAMGDQAAQRLEQAVSDKISTAADALSTLRASMEQAIDGLKGDSGMDVSMGTPGDALGVGMDEPVDDSLADELADVSLDGEDSERPKKEL